MADNFDAGGHPFQKLDRKEYASHGTFELEMYENAKLQWLSMGEINSLLLPYRSRFWNPLLCR